MPDPANELECPDWHEAVFAAVRSVPSGKVVTYGQIADHVVGFSVGARQVGAALRYAPADVPWQRVVGAGGRLPIGKLSPELLQRQRRLLLEEGIAFYKDRPLQIDMRRSQLNAEFAAGAIAESVPGSTEEAGEG